MAADHPLARQILETLRQGFVERLPQRLQAIEQCWADCRAGTADLPALREGVRLAHSLGGSAQTFGFAAVGEAAARLEAALALWLARQQLPDPEARAELDALLAALHASAADLRMPGWRPWP